MNSVLTKKVGTVLNLKFNIYIEILCSPALRKHGFFIKKMGEVLSSNSEDPLSCTCKKDKRKNVVLVFLIILFTAACLACFESDKVVSGVQADFESSIEIPVDFSKDFSIELQGELAKNDLSKLTEFAQANAKAKEHAKKKEELEKDLYEMVGEHPVREMVPYISEYEREIAGLIVGIAKKESNWGKRAPSKNGQTCYNYWGYKGAGSEGIAMGHGCFGTPEEAVDVIGERIEELVAQGLNTPSKMVVWKCGRSCAGHAPGSPEKWISDVSIYYNQIVKI